MLLNYKLHGQGQLIVLLHGLAGSLRYWDGLVPELCRSHQILAIDLLGFGRSPKPAAVIYNYHTHTASILETISNLNLTEPIHLVGHSTGALLALRLAANNPDLVSRLTLISMPVYANAAEARTDITRGQKLKDLTYFGPSSHILCTSWCQMLRLVSYRVAPLYLPGLPKCVAQDSVLHTWKSYSETLHNVVMDQAIQTDLDKVTIPVDIIYADRESQLVTTNFHNLNPGQNVRSHTISGTHNIVIDNPSEVLELINNKPGRPRAGVD